MSLNWIQVEEYSFNSFLMMERFQLRLLLRAAKQDEALAGQLGIALKGNPAVCWYFLHKCPEGRSVVEALTEKAQKAEGPQDAVCAFCGGGFCDLYHAGGYAGKVRFHLRMGQGAAF